MSAEVSSRLVSQAQYARQKGVSRQSIHELVTRGVLQLVAGKIDPDAADAQIAQLDPARSKALASVSPAKVAPPQASSQPPPPTQSQASRNAYNDARTAREITEARIAQVELEKLEQTVVDREGVARGSMEVGRMLRDSLMGLGPRIAPSLAPMTDVREISQLLEREIRKSLEDSVKLLQAVLARQSQ